MELKIYKSDHNVYVDISGRIILDECERLKNSIVGLLDKGVSQVYLDFSKVDFIDSAGLGVLVGLKMTANKNKARLILVSPSPNVSDILSVAKLESIFDIIDGAEAELLKASLIMPEYLVTTGETVKPSPRVELTGSRSRITSSALRSDEPQMESPKVTTSAPAVSDLPQTFKTDQELIDEYCKQAVEYIRQGEYEKAVTAYLNALKIDMEYLPAHNNLAIVYEKKPSWLSKAIEQWEKVLEISQKRGDQKHIERAKKHLANLKKLT